MTPEEAIGNLKDESVKQLICKVPTTDSADIIVVKNTHGLDFTMTYNTGVYTFEFEGNPLIEGKTDLVYNANILLTENGDDSLNIMGGVVRDTNTIQFDTYNANNEGGSGIGLSPIPFQFTVTIQP